MTVEGFPGKTFDYLKMNKILIGYSNPLSGLARFIEKYNVGINIDPENPDIDSALNNLKNLDEIYQNIEDVPIHSLNKQLHQVLFDICMQALFLKAFQQIFPHLESGS